MARKLRVEYGGACYHVINRGNYRRELFSAEGAAQSFIGCLMEAAERFEWRLHGYVVMSNHFHLAVETPEPNLSEGMKWLQGTWARRFNEFRQERGRPFQGRYKALHVEPGHALAQVVHYLHLNPVRAKLVTAETILQYRWSSLAQFTKKKRPEVLEATTVLWESGGLSDTPAGWKRYVEYLGLLAEEDVQRRQERYGRLSRGWAIGSEEFRTDLSRRYEAGAWQPAIGAKEGKAGRRNETDDVGFQWLARAKVGNGTSRECQPVRAALPIERSGKSSRFPAGCVKSQVVTPSRRATPRRVRSGDRLQRVQGDR